MASPQLSIIVPVYNVEKYLARCIDSILNQSFTDFELLLIDDGSKDNSGSICDAYAEKDSRIRVFHKENGGVSSARNVGLDNAKGEWIYFVDSDDELISGALESVSQSFDKTVDAILTGYVECDENGFTTYSSKLESEDSLSIDRAVAALYDSSFLGMKYLGYPWTWVVRNTIIQKLRLRFDESISVKEDTLFVAEYLCSCQNGVGFVSQPVYKYYQRVNSVMGSLVNSYNPKYLTSFDAVVKMHQVIRRRFPDDIELMKSAKTAILNRIYMIKGNMIKGKVDNRVLHKLLVKSMHQVGFPFFMSYQFARYKRRTKNFIRRKLGIIAS